MPNTDYLKQYCQYIENTGGKPFKAHFDDDFEPIGPRVRADLIDAGLAVDAVDWIKLTGAGRALATS